MVCSADDLAAWRDFPKGLRVLLVDEDESSAAETKQRLEAMEYIVTSYFKQKYAVEAILKKAETFHVAIIEVTASSRDGIFRFLEIAKDLPTVVVSDVSCLNTMMKCIALGAAEFLQKPLSEDKLRNIWQHVVHKAFNAGENAISKSLKPIKETVVSMLQLQSDAAELKMELPTKSETLKDDRGREVEMTEENDRLSGPSTPQLVKGGRLLDDGDCQDQPNCSTEKESGQNANNATEMRKFCHFESEFIYNVCNNLTEAINNTKVLPRRPNEAAAEEEVDSADGSRAGECSVVKQGSQPSLYTRNGDNVKAGAKDLKKNKSYHSSSSCSQHNRGKRKKMKVDWTPELHRRFVQAVEQLGTDQAIPSKILDLMKVEGLTRHNIASHLQKFRMHRRQILPKDEDITWQLHRNHTPKGYMQKPIVAYPPLHSSCILPSSLVYSAWGHPGYHQAGVQMWGNAGFGSPWHPHPEPWTYPGIDADSWGYPVVPPYNQCSSLPPQSPSLRSGLGATGGRSKFSKDFYDFHLAEEAIDEVVKEAMSKPWLPLPLGLKPPSVDDVLAELHRKGIHTIPPPTPPSSLPVT